MSQKCDKGWMSEDRFSDVYRKGVDSFIRFAYMNRIRNSPFCPCPCRVCQNKKSLSFALVKHDLLVNSMDQTYLVWSLHGEKTTRTSRVVKEHVEENADDENVLKETSVKEQVEDNFGEEKCELAKGKIYATCEGDSEKNPENMAKNLVNSQSKKRSIVQRTIGRCTSHNNKKYKVDQATGKIVPPSTTEKLLYGHLRSDGTLHPTAAEAHKKVTEALERIKGKGVQPNPSNLISAELEEVFGRNKNGGIRGYSSHMSKVQVQMAAIGYSALQQNDGGYAQKLNKIEADLRCIGGTMTSIGDKLNEILTCLKRKAPTSASHLGTPSPEKRSTSNAVPPNEHVMDSADSTTNLFSSDRVELLDNRGNVVASGVVEIGVNSEFCHCRKVKPTEKKIFIKEVYDQSAVVWDGPQGNGFHYLRQFLLPTCLIWSADRLQPVGSGE